MATKRQNTKALTEAVGSVIADNAPELAAAGLEALAAKQDDDLAKGVLRLLAGFVRTAGPEAIQGAATDIQALIDGDPLAIVRLRADGADAATLTLLAMTLQRAEADRKQQAAKLAAHVGAAMRDIGMFIGKAATAALSK